MWFYEQEFLSLLDNTIDDFFFHPCRFVSIVCTDQSKGFGFSRSARLRVQICSAISSSETHAIQFNLSDESNLRHIPDYQTGRLEGSDLKPIAPGLTECSRQRTRSLRKSRAYPSIASASELFASFRSQDSNDTVVARIRREIARILQRASVLKGLYYHYVCLTHSWNDLHGRYEGMVLILFIDYPIWIHPISTHESRPSVLPPPRASITPVYFVFGPCK